MAPEGINHPLKALVVVTSNADFGELTELNGRQTGAFWDESGKPIAAAVKSGMEVDVASAKGGAVPIDPVSLTPELNDLSRGETALAITMLSHTKPLKEVAKQAAGYDVVFIAGGHGASFEFPTNKYLQKIIATAYDAGHVVASVCHGPDAFRDVKLKSGQYLLEGKAATMFSKEEETHEKLTPFIPKNTGQDAMVARGAQYLKAPGAFGICTVASDRLITGENPPSINNTIDAIRAKLAEIYGLPAEKKPESVHCDVAIPPEKVWEEIGHFDTLPWHPGIQSGTVETVNGVTTRKLVAQGGSPVFTEQLLEAGPNYLRYKMTGGLPLQPVGTLLVEPNQQGGSRITWKADLDKSTVDAKTAQAVSEGVGGFYQAGLDALVEKLKRN